MEWFNWLSETGTNEWVTDFIKNNWVLLSIVFGPVIAYLKGKYPEYVDKLLTLIPGIGGTNR